MYYSVVKYKRQVGPKKIMLKYLEFLPDEEEAYYQKLRELFGKGVRICVVMSVDIRSAEVDIETGWVKYPQFGTKYHISRLINMPGYAEVKYSQVLNIEEELND